MTGIKSRSLCNSRKGGPQRTILQGRRILLGRVGKEVDFGGRVEEPICKGLKTELSSS